MRYILTLVIALAFINNVKAQSQLDQEIIKDFSIIDSISTEVLKYAFDCSKSALFEDKMKEVFSYYEERRTYYLSHSGDIELGMTKEYLNSYIQLNDDLIEFKKNVSIYNILCNEIGANSAIQKEEEIKKIIYVYDYYKALSDEHRNLFNQIRDYTYNLEYALENYPDDVTCEQLEAVKPNCDIINLNIENYLAHVDSANIQFYNLPEKHQNLKLKYDKELVEPDSEDDTKDERFFKEIARLDNARLVDYLLFDNFKGFRMDLSYEEMSKKYISNFSAPSTSKLREMADAWLKEKNCQ